MRYDELLQAVLDAESAGTPEPLRAAYEALLVEYPLLFGIWKRLADLELKHGDRRRADAVYERALVTGSHCVKLWTCYVEHAAAHWDHVADVRKLFERGASLVGCDHGAGPFWDGYIAFEAARGEGGDVSRVAALYQRVLLLPLRGVEAYWDRFQELAAERAFSELLDGEAEAALLGELEAGGGETGQAAAAASAVPGEDEGARKLRLLPLVEARYRGAQDGHVERLLLERGVTRRQYHLKPLLPAQLREWERYLEWEEARGDVPRAVLTYERCLIGCAAEAESWLRYAAFLESRGRVELARGALGRASGTFHTRDVGVLLAHAEFEEANAQGGDLSAARSLLAAAASLRDPPSLEAVLALANLERRAGDVAAAREAYRAGLASGFAGECLVFLAAHAARFERTQDPDGPHGAPAATRPPRGRHVHSHVRPT